MMMRFVGFSWMLGSFVTTLQDDYKTKARYVPPDAIFCNKFVRLCSPNEDFGSPNENLGTHFRSNFKGTSPKSSTLPLKGTSKMRSQTFGHPKSSFGEHKDDYKTKARYVPHDAIFCNNFAR
jgi:hypothetical protein